MWTFCSLAVMLWGLWEDSRQQMQNDMTHAAHELFFWRTKNPGIQHFIATCHLTHIFKVGPSLLGSPSQTIIMFLLLSYSKQTLSTALKSFFLFFYKTCYDNFSHDTPPQIILNDSISTKTIPLPDVKI